MEYQQQYSTIQADTNTISQESLDCGVKSLNWCNGSKCQNLATITNFIITLSAIGFLQGAVKTYFRISIQQAAVNLNFDPVIVDWLLMYSGIIQALAALLLILYAGKFHPMSFLGGLIILQGAFSFVAIIPTLDHLSITENVYDNITSNLCLSEHILRNQTNLVPIHSTATLVLLFILQIPIELCFTAFYTIGITYVDDNTKSTNSAIFFAIVFCSYIWGSQLGIGISYLLSKTPVEWWLGWAFLIPFLLTVGIIIALFPRKLIQTLVEQAAKKIIERNYRINLQQQHFLEDFSFLPTMTRLFTNKILILNIFALVFAETASINYFLHEQNYLQSRFFLPTSDANGLMDEWTSRFVTYFLRPPVIGISVLISGFIISRLQPKGRSIAIWNAIIGVILLLIFVSYIFIDCSTVQIAGTYRGKINQPYCSKGCICGDVEFMPVCEAKGKQTYFSPCHAGCSKTLSINNFVLYQNCTCGSYTDQLIIDGIATDGACNIKNCQIKWIIYQAFTILAAALWSTTKVGRVIITIRSVLSQDKFYALGLEIFLIGLIVYIPGKLCYDAILVNTCQYWSSNRRKCLLQDSQYYGNYLNILSAVIIAISLIFDLLVVLFAKRLDCFKKNNNEIDFFVPLQQINENENEEPNNNTDRSELLNITDIPHLIDGSPGYGRLRHINNTTKQQPNDNNVVYAEIDSHPKRENEELDFRLQNIVDNDENQGIMETKNIDSKKEQQPKETDF